jgi:hypothetical protein
MRSDGRFVIYASAPCAPSSAKMAIRNILGTGELIA